jgi:hypothetical protein
MAEVQSPLGMDDEEFLKQDLSQLEEALIAQEASQEETNQIDTSEEEQTSEEVASEDAEVTLDEVAPDEEAEASESTTEESEEEISEDAVADLEEEDVPLEDETLEDAKDTESEDTDMVDNTEIVDTEEVVEAKQDDSKETTKVDFEEAYKRIMSPFKASKRMMQVTNIDDAISLMQKGADYHSKMKTLSPHLKMISMLEKEGLLSQDKLNNLIDISKKDPKAIAQLIKDSGIDPLDIDTEEVNYKPNNYGVSDSEFKLNQVLEDIKSSPSFDKTIRIVGKEWDEESKKVISNNPEIISIINDHVFNGVYDKVQSVVDTERALGRLNIPDVAAYKQVAEQLQQQGDIVLDGQVTNPSSTSVPKTKAKDAVEIQQKRKAAAATKKTTSKANSSPRNFLSMTDEEFMKLADV